MKQNQRQALMTDQVILSNIAQTRNNFRSLILSLNNDQINQVPEGFSNNIVWNYGHAICTFLLLTYGKTNQVVAMDVKHGLKNSKREASLWVIGEAMTLKNWLNLMFQV